MLRASWGGEGKAPRGVTAPGRERVCDLIRDPGTGKPISVTTYKRLRRWWEERGYLAIAREGWTPDLSPGVLHGPGREHNLTRAYVLCIPRRAELTAMRRRRRFAQTKNGPLSMFSENDGSHARAREGNPKTRPSASSCYPTSDDQTEGHKWTKDAPRGGVAPKAGVLARVTDGWWAHLTRQFGHVRPDILLWMIDHRPGGQARTGTDDHVRNPAAWLRWRLGHWVNADGTLKLTPDEEAAARARRHRAEQARHHEQIGLSARAAAIRAARDSETAAPTPQPRWEPGSGPQVAAQPLVGWAVPRYGTVPAAAPGASRRDDGWDAVVAVAVAAAEAEEAAMREHETSPPG